MASVESYKHKAAKDVVLGWIRNGAARVGYDGNASAIGLGWRVNRGGPHFGAWLEYPVATDVRGQEVGASLVWDETGWWRDLPLPAGQACTCEPFVLCECADPQRPPTYDEMLLLQYRPRVIFDIAVQEKGALIYGIEIVHTSFPSAEKVDALNQLDCTTYVIDAEWVLR